MIENNTCIYRYEGTCTKTYEHCPQTVRYDQNNNNNVPCDMVGYSPKVIKKGDGANERDSN